MPLEQRRVQDIFLFVITIAAVLQLASPFMLLQPSFTFALTTRVFSRSTKVRANHNPFAYVCRNSNFVFKDTTAVVHCRKMGTQSGDNVMEISSLDELAQRLVDNNDDKNWKASFVVAGGGGHAISSLAATSGASSLLLEGVVAYDTASFKDYIKQEVRLEKDDKETLQYVSQAAAQLLSQAALQRALKYVSNLQKYHSCVGVACTSALVSSTKQRPDRLTRGHIVATMANGRQWGCNVMLAQSKRSRKEEDTIMSKLILQTLDRGGESSLGFACLEDGDTFDDFLYGESSKNKDEDGVVVGSNRILSGETSAALLLPSPTQDGTFVEMTRPIVPKHTLIFPGSFNPPHEGHMQLAEAAVSAMKKANATTSSFSVLMEMSLSNADKAPMEPQVALKRSHLFFKLKENLPDDWGILLTSAPLFAEKVQVLREAGNQGQIVFVIGTDTMVRIINPKYYGNSHDNMLIAIREMGQQGVRYVVGGRLQQGGDKHGGDVNTKFVTGEDDLVAMPKDVQEMFVLIREEDFRVDVSSTQLRKQAERG